MANYDLIKKLCEEKGLTLRQFADKLNMSETGLYQIFRNKSTKVSTLEDIARTLEVPVSVFFDADPHGRVYFTFMEIDEFLNKAYNAQLGGFTDHLFTYLIKEDDRYYITKTGILNLMFAFIEDEKRWNRYGILIDKLLEERNDKKVK